MMNYTYFYQTLREDILFGRIYPFSRLHDLTAMGNSTIFLVQPDNVLVGAEIETNRLSATFLVSRAQTSEL